MADSYAVNEVADAEGNVGEELNFAEDPENGGTKLTDWENEPSILKLKRDFESSWNYQRAHVAKIDEWDRLLKGEDKPAESIRDKSQGRKNRSTVQPKLIRRQAEWRYSALTEPFLSSNRLFKVDPCTASDAPAARQNDIVLNWQFRTKLNRIKFIDDFVRTTVDEGTAIVRVGWVRVTIPVKTQAPVWTHYAIQDPQSANTFQQALAQRQESPKEFADKADPATKAALDYYDESGQATVAQQNGTQEVSTDQIIENRPTVEVLFPQNVYIDPSCNGDLDKANFVVNSFDTCKADLLKEPDKYNQAALKKVNWNANSPSTEPNHRSTVPPDYAIQDVLRRKVVAYEYWGFYDVKGDGRLLPFVATWIGDVMIRMQLNPFPDDKVPFVVIPYMPKKRELYGESDAELLGDNQNIMGALFRGMIDLLGRSANSQQGIAKGMLDPLNRRRFDAGEDYEYNPSISPANGLIEHKYPELPQSALQMTQMVNNEAEALTGVKSFAGGVSGSAYGDVAAGIRSALDAASKREMAILRRLAKGMIDIGNKIVAMNAVFMSDDETVRVTDEKFVQIKREDLKGNFDLDVDINTAEVDNAKAQDLAFMLQTCGPNTGPDILLMILAEIADLKRMPELAQKLRNYKPPPNPVQDQLQQLQLQNAQLQNTLLQSQVQLHQSQVALNESKTGLEGSKADKTNLDYVEQATGTTHARDMQKVTAQARANQDLEVTKAMLSKTKPEEKQGDIESAKQFNAASSHLMHHRAGVPT